MLPRSRAPEVARQNVSGKKLRQQRSNRICGGLKTPWRDHRCCSANRHSSDGPEHDNARKRRDMSGEDPLLYHLLRVCRRRSSTEVTGEDYVDVAIA